jgi:hypothetical protein
MKIKNISKESQFVDWVEVKAWSEIETVHAEWILRNYPNLFEEVVEWKEEAKEEKVVEKKTAKKSK